METEEEVGESCLQAKDSQASLAAPEAGRGAGARSSPRASRGTALPTPELGPLASRTGDNKIPPLFATKLVLTVHSSPGAG